MTKKFSLIDDNLCIMFATDKFKKKIYFPPKKLKRKSRNPYQMQLQSPFAKRKSHMITQSDALNNQKRPKNASKMIKFPCDISPCNIPSVSHAVWVAAILRYTISRCISVWVPIVFYVPYCQAIFFCNIACCIGVRSLLKCFENMCFGRLFTNFKRNLRMQKHIVYSSESPSPTIRKCFSFSK